ncbi:phosphate metabolism protein-domain-containing protein [Mycena galopus ATCC 62051]|nr:phosphate metabolism protein-domain-containing protein [Mycena galopus ATCC 62051]
MVCFVPQVSFRFPDLVLLALRSVRRRVARLPRQLDRTLLTLKDKVKEEGERLAIPKSTREKLLQEHQREAQAEQDAAEEDAAAMFQEAEEEEERDPQQKAAEEAVMADLKNGDAPELYRKSSSASQASKKSKKSKSKKVMTKKSGSGKQGKGSVDPAAAGVDLSDEDVSSDEEEEQDDHAFDHPSTYVEQPWIWMPKDRLGLSKLLVDDLRAGGVDASDLGAVMDKKGIVEVTRNPPDEEWYAQDT